MSRYESGEKPSIKEILDALTDEDCSSDWATSILERCEPDARRDVERALKTGKLVKEVALDLGYSD